MVYVVDSNWNDIDWCIGEAVDKFNKIVVEVCLEFDVNKCKDMYFEV